MEDEKLAVDELKLIQDSLFKQEAYAYAAYRYAFVLVAGLIVGLFNGKVQLTVSQFLLFSLVVFLGFFFLQLIYRESFYGAVGRSHWLQKYLRKEIPDSYNGPCIYEAIHKLIPSKEAIVEAFKNARFVVPNGILLLLIGAAAWVKST